MTALPPPEFSRPVKLDQAVANAAGTHIEANATERAAIAARFGLLSLDRLDADYTLGDESGVLMARGHLRAALAQPCVATGEPVPETIDTPFVIRFLPEPEEGDPEEEMELSAEECDTVFFTGASIDMGEAVAETLALALEPYPRAPDADAFLKKMGVLDEGQAGPFAALAALKGKSRE